MKPMLAFKNWRRIQFPCYVQPKLNGLRCMWHPGVGLTSRDEIVWQDKVLHHIYASLEGIDVPLDGELYCHGMSLQQINGRASINRVSVHKDVGRISLNVFDTPQNMSFHDRWHSLQVVAARVGPAVSFVPTVFVTCEREADMCYRLWKQQKYEGMMYRDLDHPYGFHKKDAAPGFKVCGNKENRWNCLQKRKDWIDVVLPVRGVQEGRDGMRGMCGALVFVFEGKEFAAGSGLTFQQRQWFWSRRQDESIFNIKCRLKYEMLSDTGVPLKPTIEEVDVSE